MAKLSYLVASPHGGSVQDPSLEEMRRFLENIDPTDIEHGAAWVSDDAGNTLEFNADGTLVFDRDACNPRHMAGVSKDRTLTLWSLLAQRLVDELEREPWRPGSVPPPAPEEVTRHRQGLERWQLEQDREFYALLGAENGAICRKEACQRLSVRHSVFCRRHHFESIRGRPCSFSD